MDPSQFDGFSFAYSMPEHDSTMALTDHFGMTSSLCYDDQPNNSISHHPHIAVSPDVTVPTYGADPARGTMRLLAAEQASKHNRAPPVASSLEETGADEFGLQGSHFADNADAATKATDDKAKAPPAWSELKTKAGKERKRLPLACIACRRKKIRCSGEKPSCKHCLRSRIPCVYKVTARKAAPRTDYMAMLDKRLKRMEERIIKIVPKPEQDSVSSSVTRAVVKPAIPGTQSTNKSSSKKRGADEAFGSDLESWAKAPASKMDTDDTPAYFQTEETEETQLFRDGLDALPSKQIQEHLSEVFFDRVYGQAYLLLHKPSYMRKLKSGSLPPVLVLSVCAVAARFTDNPKIVSSTRQFLRGEEWAACARDICTKRYEWPNVTILTCLLILGLHEFGTCHGGRSWALGGQAIRMAFALQLHKDLEFDPASRDGRTRLSFVDREIRRRIMWGCFLMDRFNSSGADRPMFIREETVKIPLPVKERYFQLDMPVEAETLDGRVHSSSADPNKQDGDTSAEENLGVAAYTVRAIALWGRIISYVNQGGMEMDQHLLWESGSVFAQLTEEANNLIQTLPQSLKYSRDNIDVHLTENTASQLLLLHMSLQHNILFLNQAAVSSSNKRSKPQAPKDFLARASSKTLVAANRISEILRDAEDTQCHVSAPFAGYCAFSSTNIHISGIFSGNKALKMTSEANSTTNIKFLRKMMKYWGMFHWMVESIRRQYTEASSATRLGNAGNKDAKHASVLQYGDWFNRYPHGVSDTELMDPAVQDGKENGEDAVLEQKPELQSVGEFFTTLSPSQNTDGKDTTKSGSATKRKSTSKKHNDVLPQPESKQPDLKNNEQTSRTAPEQLGIQSQAYRGFANGQIQIPGASLQYNSQALPSPTHDFSYNHVATMAPNHVSQYAQSAPRHQPLFSTDMILMDLGQTPSGPGQALDRQLLLGGYHSESNDMATGHHPMNAIPNWNAMPSTSQADEHIHGRQNMKTAGMNNHHMQTHPQQVNAEVVGGFNTPEASANWFMYDMSHPGGSGQGLVSPAMNTTGMFGGLENTNPLDALRHSL